MKTDTSVSFVSHNADHRVEECFTYSHVYLVCEAIMLRQISLLIKHSNRLCLGKGLCGRGLGGYRPYLIAHKPLEEYTILSMHGSL